MSDEAFLLLVFPKAEGDVTYCPDAVRDGFTVAPAACWCVEGEDCLRCGQPAGWHRVLGKGGPPEQAEETSAPREKETSDG